MRKQYILILACIVTLIWSGCDQTIIVHKDKEVGGIAVVERPVEQTPIEEGTGNANGGDGVDVENADQIEFLYQITADYPEGEIKPDSVLIDGKKIEPGALLIPGPHNFRIEKVGYTTLQGQFHIPEENGAYTLIRQMICKARTIRFNITDKRSDKKITPDKVKIGAMDIHDGARLKPGEYPLEIHKKGYQSIVESRFTLDIGETDYFITRRMNSAEVRLRFQISDAENGQAIRPDRIYLDRGRTSEGSYAKPGKYVLRVFKSGYKRLKKRINIPNVPVHTIRGSMYKATINFEWKITGDYPKGDEFSPETVLVDDKEMERGGNISAGTHRVVIKNSGYETYKRNIVVPEGIPTYTLKAEMITLPRLIERAISFDVSPSMAQAKVLGPCRVTLHKIETGDYIPVESGTKIKPNTYELIIARKAYNSIRKRIRIFPALSPHKIKEQMEAKNRRVHVDITYDIDPPVNLSAHVVDFIDRQTNIRRTVKLGGTIKPGKYTYEVSQAGYKMEGDKKGIDIEPAESAFKIKAKLIAQARQISFQMEYKGDNIQPNKILINDVKYEFKNTYRPGRYHIIITFNKFQTVEKDINIIPGVGPYVVTIDMIPK